MWHPRLTGRKLGSQRSLSTNHLKALQLMVRVAPASTRSTRSGAQHLSISYFSKCLDLLDSFIDCVALSMMPAYI